MLKLFIKNKWKVFHTFNFTSVFRGQIQNYIEDIFKQMEDLLVLSTPDNGNQHLLSNDDQLFLYETAGSLIVSSTFPPEKKAVLMKQILAPIAAKFAVLMDKLKSETDEQKQLAYAQSINNAMGLAR